MKIFINTNDWTISKIENETPIVTGDNYVDTINVYYNNDPAYLNIIPTLNLLKPNNRKVGSIPFDVGTEEEPNPSSYTDEDSNTWYRFVFTLSSDNGQIDEKGKYQCTIVTNYLDTSGNIKAQRNVNVQFNVFYAVKNENSNIFILSESNPDQIIADVYQLVQTLSTAVMNLGLSKVDKADIGYVEITYDGPIVQTITGTLTAAQLAEVQKKYCIFRLKSNIYGNTVPFINVFYKFSDPSGAYFFRTIPDIGSSGFDATFTTHNILVFANGDYSISSNSTLFYTKSRADTLLAAKVDKADIGYVDLLEAGDENITTAQLTEAMKKYCVLVDREGYIYYKNWYNDSDDEIYFRCEPSIETTNGVTSAVVKEVVIVTVDRSYEVKTKNIEHYTKSKEDELLNTRVSKTQKVNGHALSGDITLDKGDVGLGNVDNTSDANKPISKATQSALDQRIRYTEVVDNLSNTSTNKPLSANQGKELKAMIDAINLLLASDNVDLDTIQEIVNYIENNKDLIDGITVTKINYTDIVDNLTSALAGVPLSAKQGYILKGLIDALNDAETGIQANEAVRQQNEATRIANENARVAAEQARVEEFATFEQTIESKQNALTTDNTINLVNDEISVNTNVIATKDYVDNSFATTAEMTTMLEEVFG